MSVQVSRHKDLAASKGIEMLVASQRFRRRASFSEDTYLYGKTGLDIAGIAPERFR